MGHRHDGAGKFRQEAFEPGDRFDVEMVGRLVEQQHVRPGEQQPGERDAPPLAAGQGGDAVVRRRAAQRVHRDLDAPVEVPGVGGVDLLLEPGLLLDQAVHLLVGQLLAEPHGDLVEPLDQRRQRPDARHDILADRQRLIEFRLLGQIADLHPVGGPGLAGDAVVQPGHDFEQRGFAGAVQPEHADLGAGEEGQPDILQHLPAAGVGLRQAFHDIDVFLRIHGFGVSGFRGRRSVKAAGCGAR